MHLAEYGCSSRRCSSCRICPLLHRCLICGTKHWGERLSEPQLNTSWQCWHIRSWKMPGTVHKQRVRKHLTVALDWRWGSGVTARRWRCCVSGRGVPLQHAVFDGKRRIIGRSCRAITCVAQRKSLENDRHCSLFLSSKIIWSHESIALAHRQHLRQR